MAGTPILIVDNDLHTIQTASATLKPEPDADIHTCDSASPHWSKSAPSTMKQSLVRSIGPQERARPSTRPAETPRGDAGIADDEKS